MTIKFGGDEISETNRIKTGCYSLDWALADILGNVGYPSGKFTELYGETTVGKTSFMVSLAGILAKAQKKSISMLDWEIQSKETLEGILDNIGYTGDFTYFYHMSKERSEETAKRFIKHFNAESPVAMVDSLGAFEPTANLEGDLSDANMGAMARETGRFIGWIITAIRKSDNPGGLIATNHTHPRIGFMMHGNDTSGGKKKAFLAHIRIDLKKAYLKAEGSANGATIDFGESWLLSGHVDKNRCGFQKRDFQVFMIGGEGINLGMTALWDCIAWGYAEKSSSQLTGKITMDGQDFGKLGYLIEHRHSESYAFVPFINKLKAEELNTEETIETDITGEEHRTKTKKNK